MGREATITYEQVAAVADTMKIAGSKPTSRAIQERYGTDRKFNGLVRPNVMQVALTGTRQPASAPMDSPAAARASRVSQLVPAEKPPIKRRGLHVKGVPS